MGNKTSKKKPSPATTTTNNSPKRLQDEQKQDDPLSDWLVVDGDFSIKVLADCHANKLEILPLFVPDYAAINQVPKDFQHHQLRWSECRDLAAQSVQNPQISLMPKAEDLSFVFAQFYRSTIENGIIPETLRLSLLSNLALLSREESVRYDLRDASTGQYLYHKTQQFAVPNIAAMLRANQWPVDPEREMEMLSLPSRKIAPRFDENDCIVYDQAMDDDDDDDSTPPRNTAFIHDLIDPNKGLFEHKLWVPSVFDCAAKVDVGRVIKSPILGLNFVKFKALYDDIGKIFKLLVQPMVERVLRYKLSSSEKVVVKAMKYVLQKPGDAYEGNIHREGMGENIVGLAIYYPQVSSRAQGMSSGALKLSIPDVCNAFLKCGAHQFEIEQGSCIAFSNQGYHQLPLLEYTSHGDDNDGRAMSRTILAFFIVNQHNTEHVVASDKAEKVHVNLEMYWRYYVANWLRLSGLEMDFVFGLVERFLLEANFEDYAYYRRYRMRTEKNKPLFEDVLGNNEFNMSQPFWEIEYCPGR